MFNFNFYRFFQQFISDMSSDFPMFHGVQMHGVHHRLILQIVAIVFGSKSFLVRCWKLLENVMNIILLRSFAVQKRFSFYSATFFPTIPTSRNDSTVFWEISCTCEKVPLQDWQGLWIFNIIFQIIETTIVTLLGQPLKLFQLLWCF